MKETTKKQIMYDSPEAARYLTNIKGWVDINTRYWGDSKSAENSARYSSCTHMKCECGQIVKKGWTLCDKCREAKNIEKYNKMPFKEYIGEPVYSDSEDKFFFNSDEIEEYCEENGINPEDLRLQVCEPTYYSEVCADYWEEVLPEDGELNSLLVKELEEFNKVIRALPPASYMPADIRTTYKPNLS